MDHKEYATTGLKLNTQVPRSLQGYTKDQIENISVELGLPVDFYTLEYGVDSNRHTINPIYKSGVDRLEEKYDKACSMRDNYQKAYYRNLINLEYSRIVKNLRLQIINNS